MWVITRLGKLDENSKDYHGGEGAKERLGDLYSLSLFNGEPAVRSYEQSFPTIQL